MRGSKADTASDSRDGGGRGREKPGIRIQTEGWRRENELKRAHFREHKQIKQSQRKFDYSIMSQNLKKELSAGHDYTSEDAPHTDRITWYITQTLIQLADAAYKQDPKPLIAHLTDTTQTTTQTSENLKASHESGGSRYSF